MICILYRLIDIDCVCAEEWNRTCNIIYYVDMLPIVKTIHGPAQIWSFDCYLVYAELGHYPARECEQRLWHTCNFRPTLDILNAQQIFLWYFSKRFPIPGIWYLYLCTKRKNQNINISFGNLSKLICLFMSRKKSGCWVDFNSGSEKTQIIRKKSEVTSQVKSIWKRKKNYVFPTLIPTNYFSL